MTALPENRFKQSLLHGRRQIGLFVALGNAYSSEIVANSGFDWLLLDAEHGPNDVRSILDQLQSVAAYQVPVVVRPTVADPWLIKQLLDIGAQTLLVPMVETAEEAAGIVASTRYPPKGIRGVGATMARASRWGTVSDYLKQAESELCLVLQIESRRGVDNIEAIAKVEGVDALFVGPSDLAADMGKIGKPNDPEVRKTVEDAIGRITACGKPAGVFAVDTDFAGTAFELGCSFIACGSDVGILVQGLAAHANRFKAITPD